jgi:hypothetical protein
VATSYARASMRMGRRTTRTPGGVEWKVGRRWLPFRLATWRSRLSASESVLWFPADGIDDLGAAVIWGATVLVLVFVAVPILLFGAELIVLGCALGLALIARVLTLRPWTVFAELADQPESLWEWRVKGWGSSLALVHGLRTSLESGEPVDSMPPGARLVRGTDQSPFGEF